MPVYEYVCRACGEHFEIEAHLEDRDELAVCPNCHGSDVEQVFSSFVCAPPRSY